MGKISVETDDAFKVTLPGYDVETATPEQCAIHSGFDYPKTEEGDTEYIELTTSSSLAAGTTVLKTVTHDLGYIPNVLVYIDVDPSNTGLSEFSILPYIFTTPAFAWFDIEVTTTQLKITFENQSGGAWSGMWPASSNLGFKYQIWVND